MAKLRTRVEAIDFRQVFPWTNIFRAFSIAADVRKLMIAAVGLILFSAGNQLINLLPFAPPSASISHGPHDWPWMQRLGYDLQFATMNGEQSPLIEVQGVLYDPAGLLRRMSGNWELVLRPARTVVDPAVNLLRSWQTWSSVAYEWTRLLWAICVWSVFGGALTRMAAVQFARDDKVSMIAALKFSTRRLLSYLAAPMLPITGILFCAGLCFVGSRAVFLGVIGEAITGGLWFLALFLGVLMTWMVIGGAAGWPLMFAAISTEDSDGFDGLSRAFSYVFERPWYYLWLIILAMVYGSVSIFAASIIAGLVVHLAAWGTSLGLPPDYAAELPWSVLSQREPPPQSMLVDTSWFWLRVVETLLVGFVYSHFWTVSTISYFLLRKSDDGTPLDQVQRVKVSNRTGENQPIPLVGTAASAQEVIERPVTADSDDEQAESDDSAALES